MTILRNSDSIMGMMHRVSLLMLTCGVLLGLSQPAYADLGQTGWCKSDTVPKIDIKTSTDQVSWDYSKSEKDLNNFTIDTVNPYGKTAITDVGGLMQGGIVLGETMSFKTLTHNRLQQICFWYDKITVTLHIKPTIYIANEFPQNSCKHNAIKEHELKHIQVDREIVNKYAALIGAGVKQELARQQVYGPYKVSQSKEAQAYMAGRIEAVLKYYNNMMDDERRRRQQLVDSLNEYERVNKMCK